MATARALRHAINTRPLATRDGGGGLLSAARNSRRLLSSSTPAAGAGDTAVHSGDDAPSDDYPDRPPRFSGAEEAIPAGGDRGGKHHAVPPSSGTKNPPPLGGSHSSSHHHQELADPAAGATFTQKRRLSLSSSSPEQRDARDPREAATPGSAESALRKVREEDREYYRTHKPSPLAEVEFADTRKPITRATDGGGGASDRYAADVQEGKVVKDTVDDSLARAEAMFREARARGNPEWPHSRVLAEMLARRREQG